MAGEDGNFKELKILIVTTAFPRWGDDGRGIFILEAARAIRQHGHQLCVLAMHNPGSKEHEMIDGIEVIRPRYLPDKLEILQKDSAGLPLVWKSNPWSRLAILPFFFVFLVKVATMARQYDIIHANWSLSGTIVWLTQWIHKKPFVVTVHGSDIFQAARIPWIRRISRRMLEKCDSIIAVSDALKEATHQIGVKKEIYVISNGVNTTAYHPGEDSGREANILFVGSLIKRKAVGILIRAFSLIQVDFPETKLVIIGEGECHKDLVELARSLDLEQKIVFTGYLPQVEIQNWMRKAMVFVLPSIEEGQGVVLLEALASGTPCVGTMVGGIPGVISPDVGKLVTPGDVSGLGQAIKEVLNSQNWNEISLNARRRAEDEFDWIIIGEKIVEVYNHVLRKVE